MEKRCQVSELEFDSCPDLFGADNPGQGLNDLQAMLQAPLVVIGHLKHEEETAIVGHLVFPKIKRNLGGHGIPFSASKMSNVSVPAPAPGGMRSSADSSKDNRTASGNSEANV